MKKVREITRSVGRPLLPFSLLVVMILWSAPLRAQYTTASLGGTVTDSSGAVIPSAKVTAGNADTGLTKSTSTASHGSYLFPALPVGHYSLTVEKSGFSTYVQRGITLTVNQAATQSITLQVGVASQEVTVSANALMINTHDATTGQLVGTRQILSLPLDGRQAQSLVFLSPGTINTTGQYCGYNCQGGVYPGAQEAAVNGGGTANVNYQLDGADHNDTYVNMNLPFPNPDAIQEFNVQTDNMSAVYGNSASVVNIVTKSGTNQFHGDAFEFVRNGDLNARNFFAPSHDTLKRNQFGGTFGGPIKKDKLFFFGTYQGTRIREAAAGNVAPDVLTSAERGGDFSSLCSTFTAGLCTSGTQLTDPAPGPNFGKPFLNNQIPKDRLSAPSLFLLQHIPLPNGPNGELTFLGPTFVETDDQFMPKIDYISGKNHLSARYFYSNYREPPNLSLAKTNLLAMEGCANSDLAQTVAINDTYSASATLLFNTWFGYDRQTGGTLSGAPFGFPDAGINIAAPVQGGAAMEGVNVGGQFGLFSGHQGVFDRNDWRIREVATLQRGSHEISFGGETFHIGTPQQNTYSQSGIFRFRGALSGSNAADFMLGQVTQFQQDAGIYYNYGSQEMNVFVQDNWRVNRKLTLNLGLRWDPYWPFTDTKNRIGCWRPGLHSSRYPNAPVGLIYAGDPGCPAGGTYSNLNNLAPRLGFAYNLGHNTVFRGGAGIYHTIPQTSMVNGVTSIPPFGPGFLLTDVNFQNPWQSAGIPNPFPAQFAGNALPPSTATFTLPVSIGNNFPAVFHIPTMSTWNFSLQHQFGNNWMTSIEYAGNMGYSLTSNQKGIMPINAAVYIPGNGPDGQPLSTEANTQQRRPYQNFGPIYETAPVFNSNYNALELNLQKRVGHGVSVIANYTWSKAMDNFPPNECAWTDPLNRNFDWGPSADNVPNALHLSEVWDTPHVKVHGAANALLNGWELNSLTSWQNGFPFTVFSGVDNSFTANGEDRADFVGTSISQAILGDRPHGQMVSQYFNTSLFSVNTIGTFGNAGKSILQGPGFFRTDFGVVKNTKITENTSVQFRAEFFNVFNNVNLFQPDSNVSDGPGVFGSIHRTAGSFGGVDTGIGAPRVLQFALKFIF